MANDPRLRRTRPHVEWQPKQATAPSVHDYRNAALGPKGYKEGKGKRRLEEMEALHQQDLEQATAQMQADDHAQAMQTDDKPTSKRQRVDDAGGFRMIPESGRVWKAPAKPAADIMKVKTKATWEEKQEAKATRQALLEQKREAVAAAKEQRKAVHQQRRAAEERKKLNKAKSEVVQKVTNAATLKKMMKNKKQKKKLRKADTN